MLGPASAYDVLGLEPGADRAAIEEAYRRLIKRYHPDRSGGDAARAAEINRAYFELRQPPERVEHPDRAGGGGAGQAARRAAARSGGRTGKRPRSSRLWPVLTGAIAILLLLVGGDRLVEMVNQIGDLRPPTLAGRGSAVQADSATLDGPLEHNAVADAVRRAQALAQRNDLAGLAQFSRACHRRMRLQPELAQLDRCAAFDDTVAAMSDPDPIYDRGPFSASAVTSRQMTAASLLSSDSLAIERRLDRIRTTVELGVRPPPPPPPPPPVVENDEMPAMPGDNAPARNSD
ncbi:MAG: J domain-containing protein [Sphingomicrobium sp.]